MPQWILVDRPGFLGKRRDEKYQEWNQQYGRDNWRLVWKIGDSVVGFLGACAVYEDAYFEFLKSRPEIVEQLVREASNVYDDEETNVYSDLDYSKQETIRTHVQDIAIRRSLVRMGRWFQGDKLIRIRQERGDHPLSITLSPGRVPFHRPQLIIQPEIIGTWWLPGTVEAFYQSNKFLQVIKNPST